ncbi:hypothetical protein RhiirA1_403161 [Rhizophagus irregularis]|uniref:CCHC-type domain-containing protein n=1 Tax=Rhizophagus irregularis TaxID=588596 RepID=A0A2N0QVM0_9GLOM|nr:hypothetical protein RhiirA1_403161 [Rhizophagus irregularis]
MQKAIQNALAQQKTEYQSLLEKQKADFQSQMVQQTKKIPPPVPPKNMEQLLDTYESANPFPDTLTREEIMRVVAKAYGPPPKPQKPEKLQSSRIDRLESKIDEIGQMTSKFGRISLNDQSRKPFYCSNCGQEGHKKNNCPRLNPVAKSNFTQCYYPQLPSTQPQYTPPDSDNEEDGYDKVENGWYYAPEKKNSQPETYDQLLSKLSPLIRKMCLSRKAQEEESKESDEWLSSLQYLNANINDLTISESFLDPGSEFGGINDPAIKVLGWKADKPSNFAIKGNSKHITDSLGWYTDVPVTLKDKEDKTVTIIGNFVRIDNGETEPMLFFGMSNIRKVQGVPEPNKNQFRIKLHGKAYIIPTFSKAPVVKDLPKKDQDQVSTDSSSLTGEKNLKKNA